MNTPIKSSLPASPADGGAGNSPANTAGVAAAVKAATTAARSRRPMSAPQRRLEATPIPGFHLHWIREVNLNSALQASYQFVTQGEVEVNHRNVSVPAEVGGTSDLSDRVTVQYGGDTLYLMKLDEALYNEDMAKLAERNANIWSQIFRGEQIAGQTQQNPGDTAHRYVKEAKAAGSELARAARRNAQPVFNRTFK